MSSEYYSLEKAAEVLGLPPGEVNRLRERSELRAFRDGSNWKFRKVDVDNFLAEIIKKRGAKSTGESDFDLLNTDDDNEEQPTLLADSSSFDTLMEDGLSLDDGLMIDAAPAKATAKKPTKPTKPSISHDDDLTMADDDGLSLADDDGLSLAKDDLVIDSVKAKPVAPTKKSAASHSDVDLAIDEDDLVLDGTGSSHQLDLAGDSGLSLLDVAADDIELRDAGKGGSDIAMELDDDDDILSLVDDNDLDFEETTNPPNVAVEDDFQLTPDGDSLVDDSESASQVIALDDENMFGAPPEQAVFGAAPQAESPFGADPTAGQGFGAAPGGSPFGGPGEFVSSGPSFAHAASSEAQYPAWTIAFLGFAVLLMAVGAFMFIDLIRHIWSWGEPFVINSAIMDLISGFIK